MAISQKIIEETVERYAQREQVRSSNVRKLSIGSLFDIDTPERVGRRLERIARSSVANLIMTEAKIPLESLSTEEFKRIAQERFFGQRDLMGISYLEYGLWISRSICRILLRSRSGRVVGFGTGFMVSPRLLLTNNHVLPDIQQAALSSVEFNYQTGLDEQMLQSSAYELDPTTFFLTNKLLDYSLIAVKERSKDLPLSNFGWNPLIEAEGKVIIGEYVNIIQHPGGEPKQLALRENQLVDLLDNFLHYKTDTAPGSSGAPIFNDQWEVVGIHHSGVPVTDRNGKILTIKGEAWIPAMGEEQIAWKANEGTRISRVIQDIKKQQNLTPGQRQLRAQLFDGSLPTRPTPATPPPHKEQTIRGLTTSYDGSATWTIPLRVSITLGQAAMALAESQLPQARVDEAPAPSPQPPVDSIPATNLPDFASDPELQEELRLLERVRRDEIPYYDETQDTQSRDQYYGDLMQEIDSLNPSELFKRLHELLKQTHAKKLAYKPSRYLYPWVDLQPNLKLKSVYSELEYTPEEIIQEDLTIEQMRTARLREVLLNESLTESQLMERADLLESQLPYNCEHVVPQSWFGKAEPMRGDLHHLFACESRCNSFRSNHPYVDFPDSEEAIRSDCGKAEGDRFEPGAGKGEVARATLYFLLRYPGYINNSNEEYKPESLDTLLRWHQAYPVTQHEKHRNIVIANSEKQGNRNPLIDFPECAEKIDFRLGIG